MTAPIKMTFLELTDQTFAELDRFLEQQSIDLDWIYQDGVLTIELPSGQKIIVNRHQPSQEIWLAATSGGFHFRWNGTHWQESKTNVHLVEKLTQLLQIS